MKHSISRWRLDLDDATKPVGSTRLGSRHLHGSLANVIRTAIERMAYEPGFGYQVGLQAFIYDTRLPEGRQVIVQMSVDDRSHLSISVRRQSKAEIIGRERRWISVPTSQILEKVF